MTRYRFVELYYHRRETGRVHTVVVYMPDVRSCLPTAEEWQGLRKQYKMALQRVLDQNHNSSSPKTSNSNPDSSSSNVKAEEGEKDETPAEAEEQENAEDVKAEEDKMETSEAGQAEQGDEDKAERMADEAETDAQDPKTTTEAIAAAADDKAVRLIKHLFTYSFTFPINHSGGL